MKLENQVITLQQAKRLKELGVMQESWCFWAQQINTGNKIELHINGIAPFIGRSHVTESYSAFTVAELGVMLPTETYTIRNTEGALQWEWQDDCNQRGWCGFASEAEARADLLIHLLENNLTTVTEVNQRLQL